MSRTVPASTIDGITRPALTLDDNGNVILIGDAAEFARLYGLKALYLGWESAAAGTTLQTTMASLTTPPAGATTPKDAAPATTMPSGTSVSPATIVTLPATTSSGSSSPELMPKGGAPTTPSPPTQIPTPTGSGHSVPPYTIGDITRPELFFDAAGNILLTPAAAEFTAMYSIKALYLGLPASTPYPPVAVLPPSTPADANAAANNVAEGAASNTPVGLTASSTSGAGLPLTFTLVADSSGGGFKIDGATGVVSVADPAKIDYETAPSHAYSVTVRASDGVLASTQTFTIGVSNAAPSVPTDANAAGNSVGEGAAAGTLVGITAASADVNGGKVSFSISADTSNGGFAIDAATGVVRVADPGKIDYESSGAGHAYAITVQASDGALTSSQTFTIGVDNVAPTTPADADSAVNSVAEGAAVNTAVGITASATDINGPAVTFSLTADSSNGGFKIDPVTGIVTISDPSKIDFESSGADHAYTITVQASDGTLSQSQSFTIGVTNVAPTQPTDANAAANSIAEGAAANTLVGVTASSSDLNGPAVVYAITADSSGGGFKVDPATGVVSIADPSKIDYESSGASHSYGVTVIASDGTASSAQTFTVAVTDVAPSALTDANAAANSVVEGAAVGTIVGVTAASTDVNGGALTYSLIADSSGGGFTINAVTGVVTVADPTKIDYETSPGHAYTVTAQASDGTLTSSQAFTIAVTDVLLQTPTDANAAADTVLEGAATGSTVGLTALASDPNGPTTVYSLTADSSGGGFTINSSTGVVTVADPSKIDYESAPGHAYSVTVQASNGVLTTSQAFAITVGDVAPATPVDADASANTVVEGAANGSIVGVTASSTDVNGPAVTFSLTGDTSGGGFTINAATGVVTVADATRIDYETAAGHAYTVTAQASDGTLTSSQTFTIGVSDVAPSTPVDSNAAANTVAEGAANGSSVGVTASSFDVNGPGVTYSLVGDTSGGGFTIDAATGVVTVGDATRIDYETAAGHAYTVTAQASDGTLTSSQTFTIAVSDVAPTTPVDSNAAVNAIAEGAANGSAVGVTASSTDVNGPGVTWTLVGDTSVGGFAIDAATGVITVADATRIDYETAAGHAYTVTAQASGGTLTASQAFVIAVTDVAPSTPVDGDAAANAAVEGAANGSTVGVTASSTDVNGPAVTFSLTDDTSGGGFTINALTGVVTVIDATKIDYETAAGHAYTVTAQASDGTLSSSQTFTIAVSNVAPTVPFDSDAGANTVAEGAANGSTVGVTASSTDVNGPGMIYSLVGDTSGGGFTIDAATGVVTVLDASKIDYETAPGHAYTVTAQASDGTLTSSQTFTIAVSDVAPSVPVDTDVGTNTIVEGAANGSTVGVTVSSADVNGPGVTYSFNGDTSGGGFAIDATTGIVTIADATKIDFESSGGSYTIIAQASDGTVTASQAFVIAVTDVAPSTPVDSDVATNTVAQGSSIGTYTGLTASSTDVNGPAVTYALVGDTSGGGFTIDATGKVIVANSSKIIYNPASPSYDVTVDASDGTLHAQQTFTIIVNPNSPPVANDDAISATEAGGAANGTPGVDPTGNLLTGTGGNGEVQDTDAQDASSALTVIAVNTGPEGASVVAGTVNSPLNGAHGTLTLDGDGSYTYVVNQTDPQVQALANFAATLTDTFNYTIQDTGGLQDTASVTFTIHGQNDTPVNTVPGARSTAEDTPVGISLVSVADVDTTALTTTLSVLHGSVNVTAGGGVTISNNGTGTVTVSGTAAQVNGALAGLTYTNTADYNGADTLTVATSDGTATDTDTVALTVTPVIDIANDTATTNEDTLVNINVNANDTFENLGHAITAINGTSIAVNGSVAVGHGSVTLLGNGTLNYTPTTDYNGSDSFTYTVTSGGVTETASVGVTINPVNDAPVNNGVPASITAMSGFAQAITGLSISDVDAGSATNLTTTLASAGGTITVGTVAGITISGSGTGSVQLLGSLAAINSALAGNNVQFTATDGAASPTTTSISVTTSDAGNTGSGGIKSDTDTISVGVLPQVWFIDSTPTSVDASAPLGSQANPFASIAAFNASTFPGVNDYIYLKEGTYTGDGINLRDGQTLLGDDQALSFANPLGGPAIVIEDATGARPTINVTTNTDEGIGLRSGNTVSGINITTGAGTTGLHNDGNSVGALTVSSVAVSGSGQGVIIDQGGGALNVVLESVSSSSGAYGIQLSGGAFTGTFSAGSGTLSGHTSSEISIIGGAGTISYAGTIGNGSGDSAQINNRTGGTVTLSGNITDTNDAGGGITASGNSGGTINLSGVTKTLNTGASAAVSVGNNTATTINFSGTNLDIDTTTATGVDIFNNSGSSYNFTGGGLTIDTTTGPGFSVSGGGTVTVTGTNNHAATAGAPALSIVGTTIGAAGVTFRDISANGGTNGIVLNNTGSSGHLAVTGSGSTTQGGDFSGGTIQNTTGAGISLINTLGPSFNNMKIATTVGSGVNGTDVTNFSFTNGTISNSGLNAAGTSVTGGVNTSNIAFNTNPTAATNNIDGTVTITNNILTNAYYHGVDIQNNAGTIDNLTISNNAITSTTSATTAQGDGIHVITYGTASTAASITKATIDGNTVNNIPLGRGIAVQGGNATAGGPGGTLGVPGNATNVIAITNNTIDGVGTDGSFGSEGIVALVQGANAASRSQGNFNISGNTVKDRLGTGISVSDFGNATVNAKIDNNIVDTNSAGKMIGSFGIGAGTSLVGTDASATPLLTLEVIGNTVTDYDGDGIRLVSNDTHGTLNATVATNQVGPAFNASQSPFNNRIRVDVGGGTGEDNTVNLDIRGNIAIGTNNPTGTPGIGIRKEGSVANVNKFAIEGITPGSPSNAQVIAFLNAQNPGFSTGYNTADKAEIINGSGFIATAGNVPQPLLAVAGGVASASGSAGVTHLSQAELDQTVQGAIAIWAAAGATAAQLATLAALTYGIADLADNRVGEHSAGHISIDVDAAGHGWFVDATPADNSEFAHAQNSSGTDLMADPSQESAGHIDLLTTVLHEMSHQLGLDDSFALQDVNDLTFVSIVDGERRLPDSVDVARAIEASLPTQAQAAEGTPIVAGTPGNDTIDAGQVDQTHGGKILFGGAGADTFVFSDSVHVGTSAQLTHVADYSAAQGDRFDLSGLTQIVHGPDFTDATIVRAVEDSSGAFATLQINTNEMGMKSGPTWAAVAQLDGAHSGDAIDVVIGAGNMAHLAHIHVDLLA